MPPASPGCGLATPPLAARAGSTHLRKRSRRTMAALSHAARRRIADHGAHRGARSDTGSEVSAQPTVRAGRPAAAAAEAAKRQLGRACSTTPCGEVRLPQRKAAAAPVKMHRDVLVAEAERNERAPTFKAHGAPPLVRPLCRSAPPSRSRRRAPPHRCREGGPFLWAPLGVSTLLPPLSSQISNPEPQILLKKGFPCVNAAGKDGKCLRYPSPSQPLNHAQVSSP